jgi:hypothetical protein
VISFTARPLTHWLEGRVGPRAGLDDVEKRKFLTLHGLELPTPRLSSQQPVTIPTALSQLLQYTDAASWVTFRFWVLQSDRSRDSVVGVATNYGVGVRVPVGSRILSSPCHSDRLWGPPNLLSNAYRGSFPGSKAAGA